MRAEKKYIVQELLGEIKDKNPLVFTDSSRCKAKDIAQLRSQLSGCKSNYRVVQNSLFKRAVDEAGFGDKVGEFKGPTAVAYGGNDAIEVIKILIKFAKDFPDNIKIKGGIVDDEYMELSGLELLSKLPSKNVLLGRLVGQLNAPISRYVMVLNGTLNKFVYALDAIAKKKGGQ